jgi:hypothetical protein
MKNIKKLNDIRNRRKTRFKGNRNDYFTSILFNLMDQYCTRISYIRKIKKLYEKKEINYVEFKHAVGFYVCSLITCWETFFIDIFIFMCNNELQITELDNKDQKNILDEDISLGEYYARNYNFQNLESIKKAFDFVFKENKNDITDYLLNNLDNYIVSKDYAILIKWDSKNVLNTKLLDILSEAFDIRHLVIHDANYKIEYNPKLLTEIEIALICIPQLFLHKNAIKYNQKRIVFNETGIYTYLTDCPKDNEYPYIFTASDYYGMVNDEFIILDNK